MSKALKITTDSKEVITKNDLFIEDNVIVETNGGLPYMIFCYQELYNTYGISAEEVSVLLYLKDLWLFSLQINVVDRKYQLRSYLKRGFLEVDYSYNNRELYRLSEKGNGVVEEFSRLMLNTNNYISENRETDLGQQSKMSSILSKFYK